MYNPLDLTGRTILVTGASSGIGRACAVMCARLGAKVVLMARNRQRLEETCSRMEGTGHCIVAGDFNAFWGDREIGLFLAATGLAISTAKPQPSFPSWKPRRQLDFILHSPLVRITDFFMPQVTYSDHLPLVCDFEIGDQKADKNRV